MSNEQEMPENFRRVLEIKGNFDKDAARINAFIAKVQEDTFNVHNKGCVNKNVHNVNNENILNLDFSQFVNFFK